MPSSDKSKPLVQQTDQADALLNIAFNAIKTYQAGLQDKPAYPSHAVLDRLKSLDEGMPQRSSDPVEILQGLAALGDATAVPTTGGRFFGFVSGGLLPTGLSARMMADSWDQASALHAMSPLAAELERVCERWIVDLLGLPQETIAGFVTGTSMATYCAFAAARLQLLKNAGWDFHRDGLFGAPDLKVVVAENAHSCIWRALRLLGFGERHIHRMPTDQNGRLRLDSGAAIDEKTLLILQAGDVNTGGFDDFTALCAVAKEKNAWVHVDGAFGLWAAASKDYAYLTDGVEAADSWATDTHKTLNAPYECGLVLCRHEALYREAMQTGAAYAPLTDKRDGMAFVPEMSRRARAIEIWAILKTLGKEGVRDLVNQICERAALMAKLLRAHDVPILNDVVFNQVLISGDTDDHTGRMLAFIQASGVCWCGGSSWKGRDVIRISVCGWETTEAHIADAASVITESYRQS